MPDDTLLISGQLGGEIGREFARINYNLGGGYTPSVLVGHSEGVGLYLIRFNYLPHRISDSRYTVADDGDSNTVKTWADYLRDFFNRRMVDGNPFDFTDEQTGDEVTVVFVDDQLTYRTVGNGIFTAEVRVRQYRAANE
jgi:hypothetical protein